MVTALPPNSQEELIAVMKNSPEEWLPYIPWMEAPNVEALLERLVQWNHHLTEAWENKPSKRRQRKDNFRKHRCKRSDLSEDNRETNRVLAAEPSESEEDEPNNSTNRSCCHEDRNPLPTPSKSTNPTVIHRSNI